MKLMRKIIICFIFLTVCTCTISAADIHTNFDKVTIASVYDGDTFKVYLSCRYHVFCKAIPVRVRGIDAPEIKTKNANEKAAALKAKAFTQDFLNSGKVLLRNCGRDKYFRLLCDVLVDDKSLAEGLLNAGLAIPYDGGTKQKYQQLYTARNIPRFVCVLALICYRIFLYGKR